MVGSLILGRTMRDSKDDDEAEAVIGAGQVALVAPSSGGLACIFGASEGAAASGATAASVSGGAVSALGVSSPAASTSSAPPPAAVPKRKFSLVLCFCICLTCAAARIASELLPIGVPRCNRGEGTLTESAFGFNPFHPKGSPHPCISNFWILLRVSLTSPGRASWSVYPARSDFSASAR